jgi:tetratricopeptide (TPR) repeat protein
MSRILIAILTLVMLSPNASYCDKAASMNKKGIAAYRDKRFDESVKQFTEALIERPDTPELRFNRGTALSALGRKDEAVSELDGAAAGFRLRDRTAAAHYNAGNAFFNAGDFRGAVDEYRRAVKLDQKSTDMRHNLELALRRLNEQKKNESKKDSDKKDENKKGDQNKSPQNQKKQEKNEQDQSRQQPSDVKPMTKEEAQQLLDAMNADEKKSLSLKNKQMQVRMRPGDDW